MKIGRSSHAPPIPTQFRVHRRTRRNMLLSLVLVPPTFSDPEFSHLQVSVRAPQPGSVVPLPLPISLILANKVYASTAAVPMSCESSPPELVSLAKRMVQPILSKATLNVWPPSTVLARHRMNIVHDRAIINVEFNIAPFSTAERKKRSKSDKRSLELASSIKQTFEPVIMTTLYPRSQIDIYLQILQDDGGTLQACINASTLALIDAGLPMIDYVCACTAGSIDKEPILDLNHIEESSESPELTVAILPKTGKMESRLHVDNFENVANLASEGCGQIQAMLDKVIRENTRGLLKKMTQ
ncbi:ribosomal protein S5 domain 2-type protein [Endogone sp. FLAS-F59071]|nr:ribosomal protein S5 domain 2-type protein [Endogone sp. FLAS-F59071]|eukprot:RUS23464.1 ribosomal protein S5 domain 2-type protein [Endogone sp. FLAS-F59071]